MLSESVRATQAASTPALPTQGTYRASEYKPNDRLLYMGVVWTITERIPVQTHNTPTRIRLRARGPAPHYDNITLERDPNSSLPGQRHL